MLTLNRMSIGFLVSIYKLNLERTLLQFVPILNKSQRNNTYLNSLLRYKAST